MMDTTIESKTFKAPDGSPYILYYRPNHDPFHIAVAEGGAVTPAQELCFALCKSNDTFFDVGANIGTVCIPAGTKGTRVHAFELLEENVCLLEKAIGANQFTDFHAHRVALSDATGTLYAVGGSAWGTACDSGDAADAVDATTIDKFVKDQKIDRLDLLKIDVEGHEKRVLQGALETLERFHPAIVIESNILTCGNHGYSFKSLLSSLAKLDYSFYRVHAGYLAPVGPDCWQEEIVCDYLCIHQATSGDRLVWPVRKRERSEIVASIVSQQDGSPVHRAYVVVIAEDAPEDVLRNPAVQEKLTQWKQEPVEPGVEHVLRVGAGMEQHTG